MKFAAEPRRALTVRSPSTVRAEAVGGHGLASGHRQQENRPRHRREDAIAAYLRHAAIAVHEVTTFYNMYNQRRWASTSSTSAPTCRCQLRDGAKALDHVKPASSASSKAAATADGRSLAEERVPGRLRRRAGDAGQRPPCSFMSNERLDADRRARRGEPEASTRPWTLDHGDGAETCPWPPHLACQIYADLNGKNWSRSRTTKRGRLAPHCGRSWRGRRPEA